MQFRLRTLVMRDSRYSIASLFLIVFWFALALGLVRLLGVFWPYPAGWRIAAILAFTTLGAGVGGIVRETRIVAVAAFCIASIPMALLSAIEYALSVIDLP